MNRLFLSARMDDGGGSRFDGWRDVFMAKTTESSGGADLKAVFIANFAPVLDEWMERTGRTQVDLANEAGIDPRTITRWRNEGITRDREDALANVSTILGVDPESWWSAFPARTATADDPAAILEESVLRKVRELLRRPDMARAVVKVIESMHEHSR